MVSPVPVICVAGPSAAGKTTLVAALQQRLSSEGRLVLRLSCDDYYRKDWIPDPRYGYDTVEAIETPALLDELERLRQRRCVDRRAYDMRLRRVSRQPVPQTYDVIVLEGAYGPQALVEPRVVSALVYLDANVLLRLIRRLRRDVIQRRRPLGYVIRQMLTEMLPGEQRFIAPLRASADLVIRDQRSGVIALQGLIDDLCGFEYLRSDSHA